MWVLYALLSAVFAALTSILAKIGIANINSNLATAIRTVVVLLMSWGIVFFTGKQHDIANIGHKNLLFWCFPALRRGCRGFAITVRCKSAKRQKSSR